MKSIIYLPLIYLLCLPANGCVSGRQARNISSSSHVETQLKLLQARSQSAPPTSKIALMMSVSSTAGVLLLGLIDSHIHLSSLASLETLSSYGVTTAVNMGCDNHTAGESAVTLNNIHATVFGAKGLVHSPSQVQEFVADVFRNGSDYMKLVAELNGFNQATQNAIVDVTHALGKVSMTRAQDYASYEVAIVSKINGIQHVPFDIPLTEEMAESIKRQAQYVTPRLNIGKIVTKNLTIESIVSSGVNLTYEAGVISVQRLLRAAGNFLEGDLIGITLHRELQYLTEAVVSSILHNLTGRGSIKEGYRADKILLNPGSNPLKKISKTMDIARVWTGGFERVPIALMMQ
ncbi:hydrolase [Trichoderma evansii]